MLIGTPTKQGTGLSIYGDYYDLTSLYETVSLAAQPLDGFDKQQKGHNLLLANFSYEIRKAYSGQRLIEKFRFDGDQEYTYFGFQVVWTDLLIFISALRHFSGYIHTDKLHQANLYLLEYITEKALFEYDSEGANIIKDYIAQRINITNKYAFVIYQAVHIKFVSNKPGKQRFRKIPNLVGNHFSEWAPEYKELIHSLDESAKTQNCAIEDLEFSDFPDIKW